MEGAKFHATLLDNPLSDSIAAMCPFILKYMKRDGEFFAALPEKPATAGGKSTTDAQKNGLYYFEGWNAFSLVFRNSSTAPFEIYHVGDFEEDIAAMLEEANSYVYINCELE